MAPVRWLIAAVVLGGAFGNATAEVEEIDANVMIIEIEVEVLRTSESVVAHLAFEDEPVLKLPLLDRGEGVFGIRTELEPKNYAVVFEVVGPGGESSNPVSLTQMGAVLGSPAGATTSTVDEEGLSEDSQQMLWLAVALGAASLSVLAFWVLGGREDDHVGETPDEEE
ncbi:MAG: hypothetical protein ACRDU9_01930 [Acidimicrobiia bacterium]